MRASKPQTRRCLSNKGKRMIPRRWVEMAPGERDCLENLAAGSSGNEAVIAEWERAVARFTGLPHAAVASSGRQGMLTILNQLGVGPNHEVIVPAYTLGDLLPLIQGLGARPVPADINLDTFNVTAETITPRITSRTRAILALHAFGAPADMPAILDAADKRRIPVIEDCAHSLGATLAGKQTGTFGHAGFFSFEYNKPVNTWGGGMVVTRDAALAESLRERQRGGMSDPAFLKTKIKGMQTEQRMFQTGAAFVPLLLFALPGVRGVMARAYRRMQRTPPPRLRYLPVQAEIGIAKLSTLPERLAARETAAKAYCDLLHPDIRPQRLLPGATSTWYFFVVRLPRSAQIPRIGLLLNGIDAGIEHEIADDCAAILDDAGCPNAAQMYRTAVALPMFDSITPEQIQKVARIINKMAV